MVTRNRARCLEDYWAGRVSCALCRRRLDVPFDALEARQLENLHYEIGNFLVPAGTAIVSAGEPAKAVFTVREGFLKLWCNDGEGHCRIVRLLRPGDVLGLEGLLQAEYALNAAALSEVALCRLPISLVRRLQHEAPALHQALETRWQRQLQRTDELLSSVVSGPSRGRVIKLLRYLADFAAPGACPRISRTDMAAMLDISSETAARVMADLKKAGLLRETPTELRFDPDRLPLDKVGEPGKCEVVHIFGATSSKD